MWGTDRIERLFRQMHHADPLIVRVPGRINLIGEHTDYNNGFVLPAAIDKTIYVAVNKRNDNKIHLHAEEYNENYIADIEKLRQQKFNWTSYVLGVVEQLLKSNYPVTGFNIVIDGDVPVGAGMASSAAIECATVFALSGLFDLGISRVDMVKIAHKAEQEFVGLQCGIMDMFSSMFGKKDHVICLDCRSCEYEYFPFKQDGVKIVLLNSSIRHSLAFSEYNNRRKECEEGVALIQQHHPQVQSLRDVNIEMLDKHVAHNKTVYNRCRFVVEENGRLLAGCVDLQKNDIHAFGKKMYATHKGLSKLFEVSCAELDILVELVKNNPGVIGTRMMGGGFGGCTINIVKEDSVEELIYDVRASYREKTGLNLSAYMASIEDGACIAETAGLYNE
ncbi:galactokinase [Parafilimonas sp.]|uniref:galactokinase n=1 Tax=Parafilimonas sp. TaxID=1969739 RepID=UPI0039E4A242